MPLGGGCVSSKLAGSLDGESTNLYQSLSHSKWDCKYHVVRLCSEKSAGTSGKFSML